MRKKSGNGASDIGAGEMDRDGNITQIKPGQKARTPKEHQPPKERTRFWTAPEIEHIANGVIGSGRPHMSVLRQAKILYLWTNAERVAGEDVAQAQRFNAKYGYKPELAYDFVLTFSKPQWDRIPEDLHELVVVHFLLHLGSDTVGRWRIEPHDFEGFLSEIDEYRGRGQADHWQEGMRRARQMGLFDGIASAELADQREEVNR